MGELEREIIATAADGPAGLAVKLRIAVDNLSMNVPNAERPGDERAALAALADAEQLAGAS